MKYYITNISIILLLLTLWSCGGNSSPDLTPDASRRVINLTPGWAESVPQVDNYIYTVASKTSRDYQSSITKADLEARKQLAITIKSEVNARITSAIIEAGYGNDSEYTETFKNSAEILVSQSIALAKTIKQKTVEEDDNFRSWVLLEFDQGIQYKLELALLKQDKIFADKLKGSQLLQEMEEKVAAYRKRKGL